MRELNLLAEYPTAAVTRIANRTIQNRIAASYRDREFFDGARENGYGGLYEDNRWVPVARRIISEYGLQPGASVLQVQCEKGFLAAELRRMGIAAQGTETSDYAIKHSAALVFKADPLALPFRDRRFDLVLALGTVYTLNETDAMQCLREIGRVGTGRSFITLASYETAEDYFLMRGWSLLGTTILKREEWLEILRHVGYQGDYWFVTAQSLGLVAGSAVLEALGR